MNFWVVAAWEAPRALNPLTEKREDLGRQLKRADMAGVSTTRREAPLCHPSDLPLGRSWVVIPPHSTLKRLPPVVHFGWHLQSRASGPLHLLEARRARTRTCPALLRPAGFLPKVCWNLAKRWVSVGVELGPSAGPEHWRAVVVVEQSLAPRRWLRRLPMEGNPRAIANLEGPGQAQTPSPA